VCVITLILVKTTREHKLTHSVFDIYIRRLMFKKEFDSSFAGFMTDGAKWLVENTDIKLIGKRWTISVS